MQNTKFLIRSRSFGGKGIVSRTAGKLNIYINSKGGFTLETENLFAQHELTAMINYLTHFLNLFQNKKIRINFRKIPINELFEKHKIKIKTYVAFEYAEEKSQKSTQEIKLLYWVTDNSHFKIDFLNRSFSKNDLHKVIEELKSIHPKWLSNKDKKNDFNLVGAPHYQKGTTLIVA